MFICKQHKQRLQSAQEMRISVQTHCRDKPQKFRDARCAHMWHSFPCHCQPGCSPEPAGITSAIPFPSAWAKRIQDQELKLRFNQGTVFLETVSPWEGPNVPESLFKGKQRGLPSVMLISLSSLWVLLWTRQSGFELWVVVSFIGLWQDRGQAASAWITHSSSLAFSRHFVTLSFAAVLKHLRWHLYNKKAVGFPD